METRTYLPNHQVPDEDKKYMEGFLAQLSQKEKELHEMAQKILGSSYFVEKSHAFITYKNSLKK